MSVACQRPTRVPTLSFSIANQHWWRQHVRSCSEPTLSFSIANNGTFSKTTFQHSFGSIPSRIQNTTWFSSELLRALAPEGHGHFNSAVHRGSEHLRFMRSSFEVRPPSSTIPEAKSEYTVDHSGARPLLEGSNKIKTQSKKAPCPPWAKHLKPTEA